MRTHWLILAVTTAAIYTSALFAQDSGAPPEPPAPVVAEQAQTEAQKLAQAAELAAPPPEPPAAPTSAPVAPVTIPEATVAATPTPAPTPGSGPSPLNFNNAEIGVVLKYLSDKTGKPVLKSEGVSKPVTLINPRAQTDAENLRLLYKVLSSMGVAVIDTGDLIMVLPLAEARKVQIPLVTGEKPEAGAEDIMTFSRQLKFTKAKDLVDRLKPMVRDGDALTADEGSNTLFYTDTRSYVERFAGLVDLVDREKSQQITTSSRSIKNASASEMLKPCLSFLETYASVVGDGSPQTTIRVEPSLNTMIIRGPAREVAAVNEIIDRLDVSPKVEIPPEVRRRPVNYVDPRVLIQSAEAFLRRFIQVGGLIGDVPQTSLVFEPSTRELIMKGPAVELDALKPVLDELDKPRTTRSRKINYADPRTVVDEAISLMVKDYAESGRPGYKHSVTWKPDPLNPSMMVFRGPVEELDLLIPLLDQLDKPVTASSRRFYKQPEQVFPEALKLLVDQYLHEGIPKYKPVTTWRRDPLNPAMIILRGPAEEMARLSALLDLLDKPLAERTRSIYSATPEVVIPAAIERMVKRLEEEGQADYRPSITWKREEFNPSILVIKGPPTELDRLFPILDQLDKPLSTQVRRFNNQTPEEVFPQAIDLMLKQYADEGQPNYRHSISWKRDPLVASQITIKGPADELARLSSWLERLDVVTTERVRKFNDKKPEEAIPAALEIMVQRMADAGQPGYRPITEWKKDELKPANVVFRGPTAELDLLFPILEQIDKAVTVQQRRFYTQKPEEVFASALTLLTEKFEKDGQIGFKPSVTWDRDPFDPSQINLRGPQEELAQLTVILDQIDKPLTERTRQFYNTKPEEAIPGGLERLVRKMAEQGNTTYKTATTWRREEFNPAVIIFRGPPAELDLLLPILDNLDKPLVTSSRAIAYATAEAVIPLAQMALKQYFVDQGRPEYEPITTFRVDPINHNLVMRGPQDEITALTTILAGIDVPRAQSTNLTSQEFAYNLAKPADLIAAAKSFLDRRVAQEGKPGDKPGVTYQDNPAIRSISLRGPAAQLSYVVPVMTAVEQTARRDSKPLIIYPKRTTAAQLYTDLSQLVTASYPVGAAPQLVQLPRLDALVISARPEDQARLQQWIDVLDSEGAESKTIKMIAIENTAPSTIATAIRTLIPTSSGVMYPDDASSRLIIRDSTASIEQIMGIVKELDQPVESKDIIFEVKHFKAASIYSAKSALDEFSNQLAQFSGKAKTKARIILEPTSLSVLIFGKKEDVKQLVEMADKLDVMALGDSKPRVVQLKNAKAVEVYSQLSQVITTITNKQNPPLIIPDARMNSLLVAASPADVTKVIDLIQGLDAPSGEAFEPTIVKLENAEVSYLYSTISQIMTGAGKVLPDYRSNSLVILDTKANVERLMPFIKQLDTSEGTEDLVLEIYHSQSANIYYLYSTLYEYSTNLAAKKGKARARTLVQLEPNTSRLILLGERDDVKDLITLAEKLDKVTFADSKPTFIYLKNAEATLVASRLTAIKTNLTSQQNPPSITPDARLNMLIVAGSPADASKIQEIVKAMDVPGSGLLTQKLLSLENAEASTLSTMIQPLLSEAGKALPDTRTNSLLILDSTDSITRVMPIIEQLDTAESKENFVVRVIQVKNADPTAIYQPVSQYVERMVTAKGTQTRGRPMVSIDAPNQAIIAIGREEDLKDIVRIVNELDKLQWQGQEPEFFQVKNGLASVVAVSIRTLMPSMARGGPSTQIVADDRINVLIVMAQPNDRERIRSLIEKLDVVDAGDLITKIIPLKAAPATTLYVPVTALKSPRGVVSYDTSTNSLIIRDTTATFARIEKIIADLDVADAKDMTIKIIPLKAATAYYLSIPVTAVKSPRGVVSYDTNSNSLIIRDTTASLERIEKMIKDLDTDDAKNMVTKIIPLKNAPAYSVYSPVYTLKSPRGYVSYDTNSNSIIIRDITPEVQRLEKLVADFDTGNTEGLVTKIIPLKAALATTVYTPVYGLKSLRGTVTYDTTSNSLIIRDTAADLERIEKLIAELDTSDAKDLLTKIIPLKSAPAASVSVPLTAIKSARGFVSVDANSNSLIIRDTTPEVQRLEKIVADLDTSGATGEWVTKVRTLHQIEPANVVTLVTSLSTQMMTRKNKTRPSMYAYSEPTSGSLIIIGPTEEVKPALELVDQLETAGKAGGNVRLFFLKYTKAMQLANQLSQVFRTARTTAGTAQTTVISDQFTNSLIAIGSDADLKRLDELVAKLDIPNAAGLEVEIFPVEGVSASQLVTYLDALSGPQGQLASDPSTNSLVVIDTRDVIQRIGKVVKELGQKGGGITARIRKLDYGQAVTMVTPITQYLALSATRQGRTSPRSGVYPEPSTNAVIIFGPTEEVTSIEALISQLDTQELAGREPRIFTLKYIQAQQFIGQLSMMLAQSNVGGVRSSIMAEPTTNSLIVIAPERDVKRLEAILQKIDVPEAGGLETRVYDLKRASAANLAKNLAPPILSVRGKAFSEPGTNMLIVTDTPDSLDRAKQFIDQIDLAKGEVISKIRRLENTSVTALSQPLEQFIGYHAQSKGLSQPMTQVMTDPSSNSLIIYGPTDEVDLVMGLIEQLDAESLFEREPKIIPLRKAKAVTLAPILEQLLALDRTGSNIPRVLPEPDSNSIIVMAPKADILRAEELLVTLDQTETKGVETHVFRLKNADAETLLDSARVVAGEDAKLFSDAASNSLIYIDTTANIEELSKLIERLDVPGMEGEITTQVVPLKNTDAEVIDNTLDNFVEQIAHRKGRSNRPLTSVTSDGASNSVVIIGPTDEVDLVKGLITKLDAETLYNREPRIIPLQKAHAATLAPILEELLIIDRKGENVPRVFAEPESNSLILLASKQDITHAQELLTTLDQAVVPGVETHVFRLKNADAQTLLVSARIIAGPEAKLIADIASNSIIYTDTTANIEELGKLIEQLDTSGMEGKLITQVVPLKNTNAMVVDNTLSEFVQHISVQKGRAQRPLTRVTSDATSNSVVVIGPTDEVNLVLGLIKELDAESLFDREPKIIPLKKARASTLALVLQELLVLDKKGTNIPRVLAEPESNSLILLASQADILRAQELLVTLDQTEAPGVETHVFRLKNADAQALVINVRAVVGPLAKIFADVPSNAIIYTDTTANIEQLGKLIEQLDTPGMEGGMITKVIPLRNTTSTTVDTTLSEFAAHISIRKGRAQRPLTRVTGDASTNSIVIIGPTDEVDQLSTLLAELDKDNLREREPKTYFLENAQAMQVGTQITQIMAQVSTGANAARIVPNPENNALLVMANPSDQTIIEQMIKTLDSPEGGLRRVHIIKLKHADAIALAQSLRTTLSQTAAITSHADSNSVIIADTDANVQKLTEIIHELDQASQREDLASEVFALENSKAGAIAQPLQMIISQFNTQRPRKNKLQLQSFADTEANSLVIIGASDEVHQLGRIVKELDAESLTDRKPEVFFLEYARATDLQTEITQLFTQAASRMGTPARIVADSWANALLVIADPRDMEWVRRLIKELDTREGRKRVVEIFTLENADASVLSDRLQGLFSPGTETGSSRSRRRNYYDDFYGGRRTETLTEGQVTIIADQRLNALIVTAEPQDMNQVADLIDALDIQAPNLEGPKVYHIENGEAETLAQTLQNLFSDTDYQGGYYYPVEREAAISGLSGKVRVTADATTNSIIVMASSPRAFDVIEQMLKELDKPSVQSGRTNIIQVKNALAQDLQKMLTELFKPDENAQSGNRSRFFMDSFFGSGGGGGGGGGGSFSNLIGKVRIEADTRTNSLLVITPEMYRPSVEKLIESLDAPTSQVLLETLIVEVTLGDDCDQGIKWGVDPTTGNVGSVTIGNREVLSFDNDRSELTDSNSYGTSVFDSAADNLQFFSLNSTSFNAVVNFLESNRKVNVQSRPCILTANNQKALVRVGTRTPTIKSIDVTSGGSTNTSVEYEKLGLTLEVTPHINSATVVSMKINLTDGAIDPTVEALNGQAYTFTDREFNTNLQVENHHTVVLAGVISEQVADQVHKVPFLNRLPYVGNKVFTNTARSSEKVELLTFITPYILNSQADVLMATEMSRKRTSSPVLRKLDLVNGDWPEVYVDDQGNPIEDGAFQAIPENPPQPPR